MENSKKDKLINLRERENVKQDKEDIVSVRKEERQFFQKQESSESSRPVSNLKEKFLNKVKRSAQEDDARGIESRDPISASRRIQNDSGKVGAIFDKAVSWLLYLLVFLLPLFILPFSVEIYEFNKVLLLFFISSLAFLIWIAKMILIDKRLTFVRTPLDMPIIAFISLILISTVFSVDKVSSILGFYGRFSDSLMVYLSLAMFYFTAVNVMTKDSESSEDSESGESSFTDNFVKAFLASAFLVIIISLIYFLGLKFIPWEEAQFRSFNLTGGSLNVLAMYLISVIIIALGYRQGRDAINRVSTNALIIISLILLMFIDFVLAWIILAVSLVVVFVLGIMLKIKIGSANSRKTRQCLVSTSLILLMSLVFITSSLTIINKKIQPDVQLNSEAIFTESLISKSVKNRLVNSDNSDQIAREDTFTREVIIDKKMAVSIAAEGAKDDLFAGIIGSGPGTYLYSFSKFKPVEFNNNTFWNIRFDKAGSEILEKVSTIGILGTLSYLLIIVLAIGMFLKMLLKIPLTPFYKGGNLYLFAAWFALLLFQFFYLEATTTKFIFWLLTAILAGQYCMSKKDWNKGCHSEGAIATEESRNDARGIESRDPSTPPPAGGSAQDDSDVMVSLSNHFILNLKKNKTAFSVSLAALLILSVFLAVSYYYQARFYKAEMAYKNSVVKQSLDQSASDFENIVKLNPYRGEYEAYLSNVSLGKLAVVLQEQKDGAVSEEDTQKIGLEAKSAIDHIKRAVELSPNNISFQQKFGSTYAILNRDLNIEKADEWAIKGYQRAIELEPTNPVLHTELGRIYILQSYRLEDDDKADQAIKEFEKAIELKADYMDAILELGLAYEAKGDYEKAIETINSLENIGNISVNTAFQLGRIYYNSGEIGEAKNIFLEIIRIEPNNSNARYSLGLIYEKEENNQAALKEFEFVLSLNPGNEEVTERVDKLKKIVEKGNKKPKPATGTVIEEENVEDEDIEDELEEEE